jgi:hypothetical protein
LKVKVEYTEDFKHLPALQVSVSTDGKNYEPITIYSLLELVHWIFRSEDLRFPQEDGYEGRRQLFRAIKEVEQGISPETVVKKYKCNKGTFDAIEFIEKPTEEEYEKLKKRRESTYDGVL